MSFELTHKYQKRLMFVVRTNPNKMYLTWAIKAAISTYKTLYI